MYKCHELPASAIDAFGEQKLTTFYVAHFVILEIFKKILEIGSRMLRL